MAHASFVTTTQSLPRELPSMRLYEKAKRFGTWHPNNIDLRQDVIDWRLCDCTDFAISRFQKRVDRIERARRATLAEVARTAAP